MADRPNYPAPHELEKGMTVEIEQSEDADPIVGEVGAVIEEADPEGTVVKLKSGARGRVRSVTHQ
ncbi:hypothetical protein EFA46_010475 [Halarchaeum sp. CBA1220]|uniref:hypothetical protein n=1 Tax=Halarchaeum sp. CBA1220 TaxID=1853682 RepID=UPI000F3A8984|nr:hypothetical protein [Halarchaeum sp. CBA1220]QLC34610.1 hypothetical protein EFA46_010475 [Halarchaeum sp. CBA1220]